MSEPLYVDPERLAQHSRPYDAAAQEWVRVQFWVGDIRNRYNGAWGDDDLGNKFGPSFLEGLDSVEGRAEGVAQTLSYYGEGLEENGRIFGEARDDADESTHTFLVDSQYIGGYEAPEGARYFGVRAGNLDPEGETTQPRLYQGVLRSERATMPGERKLARKTVPHEPGQPLQAARRVQGLLFMGVTMSVGHEPGEPLLERGQLVEGRRLLGARTNAGVEPAHPLLARQKHVEGYLPSRVEARHQSLPAEPAIPGQPLLPRQRLYAQQDNFAPLEPMERGYAIQDDYAPVERPAYRTEALRHEAMPLIEPLIEPGEQKPFYRSVNPLEPPAESE